MRHDAYSDKIGRPPDASAATATRPGSAAPYAAGQRPETTGADEFLARSAARKAPARLERRQAARSRRGVFLKGLQRDGPRPEDDEEGQGPHGQRDMAIPAGPAPHFRVIQADFPFGGLKAALERPAYARPAHDRLQGGALSRKDHIGCQLGGLADAAPHQQLAAPVGLDGIRQGQPAPVIPAGAYRTIPGTEPRPARCGQTGQDRFDLALTPAHPDICFARDRQDVGLRLGFQPQAQSSMIPVHAVAGDPRGRHTRGQGPGQHLLGQLRLGRKAPVLRNVGYSPCSRPASRAPRTAQNFIPDLKKVQGAGRHLLALIDGMLEIAKLAADRMELHLEAFDISSLLQEVVIAVQPLAAEKANTLDVRSAGDLGTMYADLAKVRQSLFNLLNNSMQV
jgi:hypothetical protein